MAMGTIRVRKERRIPRNCGLYTRARLPLKERTALEVVVAACLGQGNLE